MNINILCRLSVAFFCMICFAIQAGNTIVNMRKNVTNSQTNNSSINSGIALGGKINNSTYIKGNRINGTETKLLPNFNRLYITGALEVKINCDSDSNSNSIRINGDTNLIKLLTLNLKADRLTLKISKSYSSDKPIKLELHINRFNHLTVDGANVVSVNNINSKSFAVNASDGAEVSLAGKTAQLRLNLQGAAKVTAGQLICTKIEAIAIGATEALVNVGSELRVNASGAAKIYYNTSPMKIIKHISGAAEVKQHNSTTL